MESIVTQLRGKFDLVEILNELQLSFLRRAAAKGHVAVKQPKKLSLQIASQPCMERTSVYSVICGCRNGDKRVKPTFADKICEARSIEVDGGVAGSVHNDMAWHDDPRCQTAVCRPRH